MVAEFFAAAWVAGQIGIGLTLLTMMVLGLLGVAVVRWKSAGLLLSTIESATNPSVDTTAAVAGRALGVLAGLLVGLPGFVTSLIGLLLLVGPVRAKVEPRLAARASNWTVPFITGSGPLHGAGSRPGPFRPRGSSRPGQRGPSGHGTIIDVDLVDRDQSHSTDVDDVADVPRSARPEIS